MCTAAPRKHLRGSEKGPRLAARQAEFSQARFSALEDNGGLERHNISLNPLPDGFASLQRNQLVGDNAQQTAKTWFNVTKRRHAMLRMDQGKPWLDRNQLFDCRLKIGFCPDTLHDPCLTVRMFDRKSLAMTVPVFRFAPSPNGLLHLGHAYSALLNQRMARDAGGRLLLRIEDTDETRCRPEFVTRIYDDLAWLGLEWETPVRIQSEHFNDYHANIERLWAQKKVYPCFCSRKEAAAHSLSTLDPDGQPHYGGTCRILTRDVAVRRIADGAIHGWRMNMNACRDPGAGVWGDTVIAKRKVGSSYHIAVVTDDALQGVTHVVRGKDMEPATPIHKLLQRLLGLPTPHYHHHELIRDETGQKLSKSLRSKSIRHLREEGMTADQVHRALGFT
jgi:glutamyl-Q tRNA(Asp) synthetase